MGVKDDGQLEEHEITYLQLSDHIIEPSSLAQELEFMPIRSGDFNGGLGCGPDRDGHILVWMVTPEPLPPPIERMGGVGLVISPPTSQSDVLKALNKFKGMFEQLPDVQRALSGLIGPPEGGI